MNHILRTLVSWFVFGATMFAVAPNLQAAPARRLVPAQWKRRKLYTTQFVAGGVVPIELTKYAAVDRIARLVIRLVGSIVVTGTTSGTATGVDNPEALLVAANLSTTPQLAGMNSITNVSGRGFKYAAAFARGYLRTNTAIADTNGTKAVDIKYVVDFKRKIARKGVQWSLDMKQFSSALLQLQFGNQDTLFSGGDRVWDFSGLAVEIHADSDYDVSLPMHANEFFERTYPITAAQTDFPIDTLPQGYLYTDLIFMAEDANVLSNAIINNINIEGSGRIWTPQDGNNAPIIQETGTFDRNIISDAAFDSTGIYPLVLRDGMFTKAIDALTSPLFIRLNVSLGVGTTVVRLVGRRMVPDVSDKTAA